MPLSAAQFKVLVVTEVGDVDSLVAGQIDVLWTLYDSQADDYIHYLYTKRKSLDLLMGQVREQVTRQVDGPLLVNLTDKLKNLQTMWTNVDREIATLAAKAIADAELAAVTGGQAAVGQLTTTAPITPAWGPDGNNPLYRGDLYGGWPR